MSVKNGLETGFTYAIAMYHKKRMRSKWVRLSVKVTEDEAKELVAAYRDDPTLRGWTIKLGIMGV